MLKEFGPTIRFLLRFVGIYVVGNLLYGWYVTINYPAADPATQWVTEQTAVVLHLFDDTVNTSEHPSKPFVLLNQGNRAVVSVFEGCNGINVMVIFLAFVFAFGKPGKDLFWFVPIGIVILHVSNIARLAGLYYVNLAFPRSVYFIHKYVFTASIFAVVFVLWIFWVRRVKTREQQ